MKIILLISEPHLVHQPLYPRSFCFFFRPAGSANKPVHYGAGQHVPQDFPI
jgi:hypothetical protein